MRVPGFEPGISPPQGEVLTTILHTPGEAGYRSLYLSHAKRALYHLSYIPTLPHVTHTPLHASRHGTHTAARRPSLTSYRAASQSATTIAVAESHAHFDPTTVAWSAADHRSLVEQL